MDYMEKITELRASKAKLNEQAQALVTEGKFEDANKLADQMEGINKQIQAVERLLDESRKHAVPLDGKYDGILHDEGTGKPKDGKKDAVKPFATLGEQLKAVYDLRKGLVADERLEKVNNAAGVTGTNGPDGGFALQEDFAGAILESAVRQSPLLNRLDRYTCSSAANAMRWLHADETDISTSVFGGIQMFWAAEGATVAASKPQFREMKLDLEKMMGFCYCTDEMLQDAAFLTGFVGNGFTLAADDREYHHWRRRGKAAGPAAFWSPDFCGKGNRPGSRHHPGGKCHQDAGTDHASRQGAFGVADAP